MVCIRRGFRGLLLSGAVERTGRLPYIDGCSDTLLLAPPIMGDPCLNFLHVPPHVSQTEHTHPSVRVGYIIAGHGWCETPDGNREMSQGLIFILPPNGRHSFHTGAEHLEILVYHPDSDFGPTPLNHPMINKTLLIAGNSAVAQSAGRENS